MSMARMRDIAERAGVSRTTVSCILNQKPTNVRVSEETRQRVLQAAAELGYRSSELARAVNSGRQQAVGFVFEPSLLVNRVGLLTGAMEEAAEAGYYIRLIPTTTEALQKGQVEHITEMRLTGVLAAFIEMDIIARLQREMNYYNVPLVVLETGSVFTYLPPPGTSLLPGQSQRKLINVTEYGAKIATAHLISLGHRRLAHVAGIDNGATRMRNLGFHTALMEAGLPVIPENTIYSHYTDEAIIEAVRPILQLSDRPTALLCANDIIAMSAMRAARRAGLRLPEDLSLIGFGDIPTGARLDPALTTVAISYEETGRAAVRTLLNNAAQQSKQENTILPLTVPLPRLIQRESAQPPR